MPKFCPKCEKSMKLFTNTGKIVFRCPICSTQIDGNDYDVRMPSAFHASEETPELWINIIKNSPHDRVSTLVPKQCKNCPLNYMVQLVLGKNKSVVYSCKCGYNTLGELKTNGEEETKINITGAASTEDSKAKSYDISSTLESIFPEFKISGDKKCAWAVLIMKGDAYIPGALVTGHSLRNVKTRHQLVCMVTDDVSNSGVTALKQVYDDVVLIPVIEVESKHLISQKQEQIYGNWKSSSYTKWNVMNLTKYCKVMLIDADKIVLSNIDHLFDLHTPAGTFSSPWAGKVIYKAKNNGDKITSHEIKAGLDGGYVLIGTMVLVSPNAFEYKSFLDWIKGFGAGGYGHQSCISMLDEQSITEFYNNSGKHFSMIGAEYNAIPWKYEWLGGRIPRVFHYFNKDKPWGELGADWRGKYLDIEAWWALAGLLVKEKPEVKPFFLEKGLKIPVIKKCAYCEAMKLKNDHYIINPDSGVLDCPVLSKIE